MQYPMDQKKSHFAFQGMTHFFGLEGGLVDVDGNIALQSRGRGVPKRNHIGGAIDAAKSAVQFPDPLVPRDIYGKLHWAANLLPGKRISRQPLKIVAGVGASWNASGFK